MKIGRMKMILSDWLYAAVVHGNQWGKDSYSVFMLLACMICKKNRRKNKSNYHICRSMDIVYDQYKNKER